MDPECWDMTQVLRDWMFENIYTDSPAKLEEGKARHVVRTLYEYYMNFLRDYCDDEKRIERIVTDYISGMTDQYAIEKYKEKFIPQPFSTHTKDENFLKILYDINGKEKV